MDIILKHIWHISDYYWSLRCNTTNKLIGLNLVVRKRMSSAYTHILTVIISKPGTGADVLNSLIVSHLQQKTKRPDRLADTSGYSDQQPNIKEAWLMRWPILSLLRERTVGRTDILRHKTIYHLPESFWEQRISIFNEQLIKQHTVRLNYP